MIAIVAISITVNLIILVWKFKSGRKPDGGIDACLMVLVFILFQGSFNALSVGTLGSALFSLWTLPFPIIKPKERVQPSPAKSNQSSLSYDEVYRKMMSR